MKKFLVIIPGEDCFDEVEEHDLSTLKHQFEVVEVQQIDNTIAMNAEVCSSEMTDWFRKYTKDHIENYKALKIKYKECLGWLDNAEIGERFIIELSKFTPTLVVRIK